MSSWRSGRWRQAWRPDVDLAEAEGLAAGTGLLTGSIAHAQRGPAAIQPCPACDGAGDVVVVDLVSEASTHRCGECGHRWTVPDNGLDESAEPSAERTG